MSDKLLRPIPLEELWDKWARYGVGLLECIRNTKAHYKPEDVYVDLRSGRSHLYEIGDFGFVIFQQHQDPDGLVLFVYALWCKAGEYQKRLAAVYEELEEFARSMKAKRIRMQGRDGWSKHRFFTETARVYEHEVGNGQSA